MTRRTLVLALPIVATLATSCADRPLQADHYLDPKTAVTLTSMPAPWVYAHEEPTLVAHARDYVNVGVIESNRAGQHAYWLGTVEWSTIDRSPYGLGPLGKVAELDLEWPDHVVRTLAPEPRGRHAVGTERAYFDAPHSARARENWFALAPEQLRELTAQMPARIVVHDVDGRERVYLPWEVDAGALQALVGEH
jgi:hypothetical protein